MNTYRIFLYYFCGLFFLIFVFGCKNRPGFDVANFDPLANIPSVEHDTIPMNIQIQENIFNGVMIPDNGYFRISFDLKNKNKSIKSFYYKIFYRNESYSNEVNIGLGDTVKYNPLASENFYGSWSPVSDSFHVISKNNTNQDWITVMDSFQIVGNPRDEELYFGKEEMEVYPDMNRIKEVMQNIMDTPDWMESIKIKALDQKRSVDEQVYLDALWILRHDRDKGQINNRWKRNPRAGVYSFVLLVVPEEELINVPNHIKFIGKKAGDTLFQDPYFGLFHESLKSKKNWVIIKSDKHLKARIVFDLSRGIYFDPLKYTNPILESSSFDEQCNYTESLYKQAQVQQFFHNIDKNFIMENIPVVKDLNEFTQQDYKLYEGKYSSGGLLQDHIRISDSPCKTIEYSDEAGAIVLKNPASTASEKRKENVGIQSRVGFTYGKVTAKIQFPKMLSKDEVWNGITNAFWMIYQEESEWNNRRICEEVGYIPKSEHGKTDVRIPTTYYTEIDIEIVKASKHWPVSSYYNNVAFPADDLDKEDDIIVTCTNWDLACNEPDSFNVGLFDVRHLDKSYYPHRWDHWYKALTMKYAVNHDSLFERDYYYYQIDWQPDCIIWRIGPETDRMVEVGYLDKTVSSIPNNQMTFIVTQEYHHSEWWPTTTFKQEFIPYPANELVGKVYEVFIE